MSIREVNATAITDAVEELCIRANTQLPPDVKQALDNAHAAEPWPLARQTLELLQQNLCVAAEKDLPICQDTGMACVFIELGQDVHINGNLDEAVNEGVRRGYEKAYLRKSITADPLQRVNTGDNTPAFLTVHLVPGDVCKITVAPKGAGSENMSRLTMLKPADGVQGVKDFVMETVKQAGANPCPPIVLGIGIGGSFDKCAALAKKALLRPLDQPGAQGSRAGRSQCRSGSQGIFPADGSPSYQRHHGAGEAGGYCGGESASGVHQCHSDQTNCRTHGRGTGLGTGRNTLRRYRL